MSKNLIDQGINEMGGEDGGIISNGSVATAALTGLAATWIEVDTATTFTVANGWDQRTATAYTFLGVNIPTGVAVVAGTRIGAGYAKSFTNLTHNGGQITYYTNKPS